MAETNMYLRRGKWVLRVMIGGMLYRESLYVADVREARRLRDKRIKEIEAEVRHGEARVPWMAAVAQWIDHAEGQISRSTLKRYCTSILQIESAPWFHLTVDKIDAKAVAAFVQARRKAGATPATIKRDLTALSSVLSYAQSLGQREGNPALDHARLIRERRPPIALPTDDGIAAVCAAATPEFAALIVAARLTGARQGELVAVKWPAFNESASTLELIGKGSKRRVISLSPVALAHISGLARHGDFIFCARDGKPFVNAAWDFRRYSAQARRRATFAPFRFHDLRHLFAVEALRGGMGVYALSHHMGHSSVGVTEIYLTFLSGEQAQRAKAA
jgi:integrase/recombinase XerD